MQRRLCGMIAATVITLFSHTPRSSAADFDLEVAAPTESKQWLARHFAEIPQVPPGSAVRLNEPPFSFRYDGTSSHDLPWSLTRTTRELDACRKEHTLVWLHEPSRLVVRCVVVEYLDYPVVEWTVFIRNMGRDNTRILEDIQGLDAQFAFEATDDVVLHTIKGDFCTADSFEPLHLPLALESTLKFAPPASGKSSDGPNGWPYFNLQHPEGGTILAVGWPGQWACSLARDQAGAVRVRAGQELTHLYLKPDEEVRTPLIALLFWKGSDVIAAQNLWRRWYVTHNMPRVADELPTALAQIQVGGGEADIAYVQKFLDAGIHVDLCWRDAGGSPDNVWFPAGKGPFNVPGLAWLNSGTWDVDLTKYPHGFRPFSDWIHARQMQFVLWFEPERVGDPDSWLGKNHPEWLLPGTSHGALLDEGNPEARQWLIDHVSDLIRLQGIDWYREDMNGAGPLPAWRQHDAADRQGSTENHYIQGHLAYWDALRSRFPQLRIDSCASGGRRNDLETMRRAVPLLRSDFQFPDMEGVIEGNQGHTYGLSSWLPFQGTGCYLYEPYAYRSFYLPSFGMGGLNVDNLAAQQKAYGECRLVAPLMLADYYPLTPYSRERTTWIAWQFDQPATGKGCVQVFRRPASADAEMCLPLRGIKLDSRYKVTDLDSGQSRLLTGRELAEKGLTVTISQQPGSAVLLYTREE